MSWTTDIVNERTVKPKCAYMINSYPKVLPKKFPGGVFLVDNEDIREVDQGPMTPWQTGSMKSRRNAQGGLGKVLSVTPVDIDVVEGKGRKCVAWKVQGPNEHKIVEPACEQWEEDAAHAKVSV